MKLLIDTNVVLDVLLKREPFLKTSFEILELSQKENINEYISASSITDIYYIANRQIHDRGAVLKLITDLLKIIHIAGVNEEEIIFALKLGWQDFEDAVQYAVSLYFDADLIVTRNPSDYKDSKIPVLTPEQALNFISKSFKPDLKIVK